MRECASGEMFQIAPNNIASMFHCRSGYRRFFLVTEDQKRHKSRNLPVIWMGISCK